MEGAREELRSKEGVRMGCLAKFSRISVPLQRLRVVGIFFGLSVCVVGVFRSVLDVIILFSSMNGDCEVLYDSDCEFVEPHFFLSQKNAKGVFFAAN